MAITDNIFTADEMKAAITANPALLDIMKESSKGAGFFVYKDTELNTYLETERQNAVNAATSQIYSKLDQDIIGLTGATKGNEKTYEFIKRVIAENQTKQTGLETSIGLLNEQIKKGGDATLQTKYEALEAEYKRVNEIVIPGLNTKLFQTQVGGEIEKVQKGLQFNPAYDQDVIDTLVGVATQKMMAAAKMEGDKINFMDGDNKPFMNGIEVATAKDVFLKFLPGNALDNGKTLPGGGTAAPGTVTTHMNPDGKAISIPGDMKSKVQLHEFLIGQGLAANSAEFIAIDKEYNKLPTV